MHAGTLGPSHPTPPAQLPRRDAPRLWGRCHGAPTRTAPSRLPRTSSAFKAVTSCGGRPGPHTGVGKGCSGRQGLQASQCRLSGSLTQTSPKGRLPCAVRTRAPHLPPLRPPCCSWTVLPARPPRPPGLSTFLSCLLGALLAVLGAASCEPHARAARALSQHAPHSPNTPPCTTCSPGMPRAPQLFPPTLLTPVRAPRPLPFLWRRAGVGRSGIQCARPCSCGGREQPHPRSVSAGEP